MSKIKIKLSESDIANVIASLSSALAVRGKAAPADDSSAYGEYIIDYLEHGDRERRTLVTPGEYQAEGPLSLEDDDAWECAGRVFVDSGMVMLTDPMHLGEYWKPDAEETPTVAPAWRHTDGSILYCTLHGVAPHPEAIGFARYDHVVPRYSKTPSQMRKDGELQAVPPPEPTKEFSYSGCCDATRDFYGQLNFDAEQAGAGVAFRTGLGDGMYPVYVRVVAIPGFGERVAEARIVFIEKDEESDAAALMQSVSSGEGGVR